MTQLILVISLWGIVFLYFKGFCYSYAWSCSLYERQTSFCMWLISRNLCDFLCFWLALLHSASYFFLLYWLPSSSLCTIFDAISSYIDEVLSLKPSTNVFVFGDFNTHHEDWLTYTGGTDTPGEPCYNFYLRWPHSDVRFPTWIPLTVTLTGCSLSSHSLWPFWCWLGWSLW